MTSGDYKGIDIAKFAMSFAVIAIHAPEYLWPEERQYPFVIDWFIRLAVPFFFIISGFLIQGKLLNLYSITSKRDYLKTRFIKLIRIWLIWSLIYLPLSLWGYNHEAGSMFDRISNALYDMFFSGHMVYAQPLWFIYSMAFIMGIWQLFLKFSDKLIFLALIFLVLTGIVHFTRSSGINGIKYFNDIATWVLGGGLPIMGGALLQSFLKGNHRYNQSNIALGCLSVISLILSLSLKFLNLPFWPFCGGMVIATVSILFNPKFSFDTHELRDESMWIYYLHMYVIMVFMALLRKFDLETNIGLLFGLLCVVVWMFAFIITKISNHKKFMFIRQLVK